MNSSLKTSTCYSESTSGMFSFFRKLHVCINEFLETQMSLQETQQFCWRLKRCWHRPAHSPVTGHRSHRLMLISACDFSKAFLRSFVNLCIYKTPALKNGISKRLGLQPHSAKGLYARLMDQNHCKFLLTVSEARGKSQLAYSDW